MVDGLDGVFVVQFKAVGLPNARDRKRAALAVLYWGQPAIGNRGVKTLV